MPNHLTQGPMSGDEAVRRVKVALAEMGYGDRCVTLADLRPHVDQFAVLLPRDTPLAIAWMAYSVVYPRLACWSCWHEHSGDNERSRACLLGDCANLGPARPPRELLVTQGPKDAAYSVKGAR